VAVDGAIRGVVLELQQQQQVGQGGTAVGEHEDATVGPSSSGSGPTVSVTAAAVQTEVGLSPAVQTEVGLSPEFASDADLSKVQFSRPQKAGGGLMGMASGASPDALRLPATAVSATLAKAGLRAALQVPST
jgi:hypothetical protein